MTDLFYSAAVAAYSTLRPHERVSFDQILGAKAGHSSAAKYLAAAVNSDRWADQVHPWWTAHADDLVAALQFMTEVNRVEARALLTCTLYTRCAIHVDVAVADVRQHTERAAAYLAGATREHR